MLKLELPKRYLTALMLVICLAIPGIRAHAQNTATPAAAQSTSAEGAGERKYELIPKLDDPEQRHEAVMSALWVIIIFVILLAILYPTAWKQVLAGLKKREERIRKDLGDAEAARRKAEETQKELVAQLAAAEAKVRDIIAKGVSDAEKIATSIKSQATAEAESQRERAVKDIDAAKHAAIAEVYSQTAELATSIAGKILQRNLNADDQRDLVNRSLEQLQNL
jgi:F-type H+-transporting ATPase subunit b